MILQCSVFTESLSVPAFLQNRKDTGFCCFSDIEILTQEHSEAEDTYSAMISQKDVFFQTFSECYPQGSILVALEGAADHSSKMLETWTCSY